MIKILHLELVGQIGGIESFLINVLKNIDHQRFQFDFVATVKEPAFKREIIKNGSNIYYIPRVSNVLGYYSGLEKIIGRKKYDIIHVHKNSAANIISIIAAKKNGIPVVVHSHNTAPSKGRISYLLHKINRRYLIQNSDVRLGCSEVAGKWLFGNDKKVILIKNGIDLDKYQYSEKIRKEIRESLGFQKETVYCHIGRFTKQKNHEFLIDIFEEIYKRNKNSRLVLIGTGPEQGTIKNKVKRKQLKEAVLFLNERSDVNRILQGMDMFLLPSLYEGLGIVGIEAQAAGLPVIASKNVPTELNVSGNVRYVSLHDKPAVWADIVKDYLKKFERETMADITKKRLLKAGYDIGSTTKKLEKIYEILVSR